MKEIAYFTVVWAFLLLLFACNKPWDRQLAGTNRSATGKSSSSSLLGEPSCPVVPFIPDVDAFAAGNHVADAPVNPFTGGTAEQNALNNYQRIQYCLVKYGHAVLNSGTFPVSDILALNNASLTSANSDWPVIRATSSGQNKLLAVYNNSRVGFLKLDANKMYLTAENASVIEVTGNGNQIDNSWIEVSDAGPLQPGDIGNIAGVYIMGCADNNTIMNNKITNCHNGVVVNAAATSTLGNVVRDNEIFYNRSDGVSIATYITLTGNLIHHNGWDCQNWWSATESLHVRPGWTQGALPIPGAGIYALGNIRGALIQGNTVYDNNGNNMDIDNCTNFSILDNVAYDPGNKFFTGSGYTVAPVVGGAMCVVLINVGQSTVQGNDLRNEGRSWNRLDGGMPYGDDPNFIFSAYAVHDLSDLPFGDSSIISFCLAERRSNIVQLQTGGNVIRNNIFRASPSGIGYFTSRNTGYAFDHSWSSTTTNYFTLNNPYGSNVGSVRCGGNWFAANGVDVNQDDFQHQPPGSDWTHGDLKPFYLP